MNRALKLVGGIIALSVIMAAVAILLSPAWLAPFAETRIAAATGRDVHIGGLELRPGGCLRITANDVRISNPDWARTPALIDSKAASGCAKWLPLLTGRLELKTARVESTRLGLEREGDRATWNMGKKDEKRQRRVTANRVVVIDSSIYFRDRDKKTAMDIKVSGARGEGDELRLRATGSLRNAPMLIDASTTALLPSEDSPTSVSFSAKMGSTTAEGVGKFRQLGFEGMDVQLSLAGNDLSAINRLGINLPATPPYKLRGRLAHSGDDTWRFSSFAGRIGDSDINGELEYVLRKPRPLLRADVYAKLLDFDDLGPLVGAPPKTKGRETASPQQRAQAQQVKVKERVLPDKPLGIEKWPRMDADVHFRADRVLRPNAIPVDGLSTHLIIDASKLRMEPLDFEMAGGRIKTTITVDGKAQPPRGSLSADIENLDLARMFPKLDQQRAAAGKLFGRLELDAAGHSIATFAGSANGGVTLMVNGGHISALLLEIAGLDAGESLALLLTRGDQPVPLRCAIADFDLNNGEAKSKLAVVDTEDTMFIVQGTVNLGEEALALKVTPQPKDQSLPVVRTPLNVSGHFIDPSVRPEAAPLLARGAAAVALGLVNPLLALIPLIETGPGKDSDCAAFARVAQGEGVKAAVTAP
jgi:uncharacterized protein involved in outer membrane biogenesis